MAISGDSATLARSLSYALAAPLVFVACTFPRVTSEGGGQPTEGSIEPAPDGKVEASETTSEMDSTIDVNETSAEATVDASTADRVPTHEGGGDVGTVDDSAAADAGPIADGPLDVLELACDCGAGQSPYATGITCGLLNLGQCNGTAGFIDTPACGQEGMWVQCMMSTLVLCVPGTPQPKLQQCQ